jgi:sulfotransferase famil protein
MTRDFNRIVFVHVPKTAGTAIRAALNAERRNDMLLDYGKRSRSTTAEVRKYLAVDDRAGLCAALAARKRFVVFGHLKAADYRPLQPAVDFVTFLRDPFDRVVSEFNHFVKHHKYTQPFRKFIDSPPFRNRQSLFTDGIPLEAYSFVGLYETYDEDIARLAAHMGVTIAPRRINIGDYADVDKAVLWERHGAHFRATNARDYALVARAREMRERAGWNHAALPQDV